MRENANAEMHRARACVRMYESAGETRRYPRRIKGRAETRLKNHDARVRACVAASLSLSLFPSPSFLPSLSALLVQLSARFTVRAAPPRI